MFVEEMNIKHSYIHLQTVVLSSYTLSIKYTIVSMQSPVRVSYLSQFFSCSQKFYNQRFPKADMSGNKCPLLEPNSNENLHTFDKPLLRLLALQQEVRCKNLFHKFFYIIRHAVLKQTCGQLLQIQLNLSNKLCLLHPHYYTFNGA